MVIRHLKQIGKVKKLGKWVTHELIANQKNWFFWFSFWSIIFSYSMQQQWDISQLDCDMRWQMDFIWQPVMISSVVRPRRSSKAKLVPRKGNGHCLVVCCLSDPLQLSESQQNHYIWEVCSANQWDALRTATPAASIGQQKGPNSSPQQCPTTYHPSMLQKLNKLGYKVLPHLLYSHELLPIDYHFFKNLDNFLQGKCFHKQQEAEDAFQEFIDSLSMDFYTTR